ncbi:MAG: hypothetical protein ACI8W3_002431 [Myxococcota bacterium]|jgi:hypothetical protein
MDRQFQLASASAIVFACLFVYVDQLGFYFTDVDSFSLIATSRFHSFDEFLSIFTSPMMKGQLPNALFWRPLSSVTWGIDELIWGLNPLGYHLTDLVIHIVNCLLLFTLVRKTARWQSRNETGDPSEGGLARGDVEALVVALLFAIHPIAVESVSAIARRPDLLFGTFSLLALNATQRYLEFEKTRGIAVIALCCVLGLASKDSAVITLALIGAFVFCFAESTTFKDRLLICVRVCIGPLVAVALYIGLRALVLDGLGGYESAFGLDFGSVVKTSLFVFLSAFAVPGHLDFVGPNRAPLLLVFAVLLGATCAVRLLKEWAGPQARRVAFATLCVALFFALYMVTRTAALTRTIYSLLPFFCMLVGWGLVDTIALVREFGARSRDASVATLTARVVLGTVWIGLVALVLQATWRGTYVEEWRGMGELTRDVVDSLENSIHRVAAGSVVYTINLPFKVSDPAPRLRDHPIVTDYSLQGWADLAHPEKQLYIVGLTKLRIFLDDPADLESQISYDPIRSRIDIQIGSEGSVEAFWQQKRWGRMHPVRDVTDEAARKEGRLSVELLPVAYDRKPIAFWVYAGDEVTVQKNQAWTVAHRPVNH